MGLSGPGFTVCAVGQAGQLSFGDMDSTADVALRDTTFVVVDLETTGGRSRAATPGGVCDAITEIGAVKVRGGVVLGEFATLVDPGREIPPQIVRLTGITTAMAHDAPKIDAVLPMFLEFSRGAVLVAHNAGFDIGFLRAAAAQCALTWPNPPRMRPTIALARPMRRSEIPPRIMISPARMNSGIATSDAEPAPAVTCCASTSGGRSI